MRRIGVAVLLAAGVSGAGSAVVFEISAGQAVAVRSGATVTTASVITVGATAETDASESESAVFEAAPDVPAPAVTLLDGPATPAAFQAAVLGAARRYDVSPDLLAALVWQESRWQPAALSSKGAIGLAQLMPATARALAVDPRDSGANLAGAAHYLRQLLDLFDGDVEKALAAYNAGPARVLKAGGVPAIAETRDYVARIIDRLAAIRAGATMGVTQP